MNTASTIYYVAYFDLDLVYLQDDRSQDPFKTSMKHLRCLKINVLTFLVECTHVEHLAGGVHVCIVASDYLSNAREVGGWHAPVTSLWWENPLLPLLSSCITLVCSTITSAIFMNVLRLLQFICHNLDSLLRVTPRI